MATSFKMVKTTPCLRDKTWLANPVLLAVISWGCVERDHVQAYIWIALLLQPPCQHPKPHLKLISQHLTRWCFGKELQSKVFLDVRNYLRSY